jgi:hypothetical protein
MTKSHHTGIRFFKESQLLEPVAKFAKRRGFRLQVKELPFYEYRIDLYGFSAKDDVTIAIELKLTDWRRALEQAMLYQLCSDLVYIAMPESSARRVNQTELENNGIGLISVLKSGACACLLPATEHGEVRQFYRSTQIEFLKDAASA